MSRYWSDLVKRLTPYVPGEQPARKDLIKLNTNENPYPPSPAVMAAIADTDADSLRRYPDPESMSLKRALAQRHGLSAPQVFVGNGSDEVLAHVFQGLLKHDRPVCFPDITYSFYPVWCELYGIDFCNIPLTDEFCIDVTAYPADNGGVIIANPNAPTGRLLPLDDIRRLLERSVDSVVVIDEAYVDFGGDSAATLIPEYPNLLVVQTLSKSRALAGLRVGMAMGESALVEALDRVKNSFNSYPLDAIAQRAALAAIEDEAYYSDCSRRVAASRERLTGGMTSLGFEVLPSAANFILATHPSHPARELFSQLRDRAILVRYFDKPRIDEYLRISIGTEEDCETLLVALAEILSS
jgi:histidinol-phosphate aminotransferase